MTRTKGGRLERHSWRYSLPWELKVMKLVYGSLCRASNLTSSSFTRHPSEEIDHVFRGPWWTTHLDSHGFHLDERYSFVDAKTQGGLIHNEFSQDVFLKAPSVGLTKRPSLMVSFRILQSTELTNQWLALVTMGY